MNAPLRRGERGVALLNVLLLMTLVSAVSAGAALLARNEALVANFHRREQDAAYAAQAALAIALQDLDREPDWGAVLAGLRQASFTDGSVTAAHHFPGGSTLMVCCAPASMTGRARAESGHPWQPFGWQSLQALVGVSTAPPHYVVAWVADDPGDPDGDPAADANGRLLLRTESAAALGMRKALEVLVERGPFDDAAGAYPSGLKILSWGEGQ